MFSFKDFLHMPTKKEPHLQTETLCETQYRRYKESEELSEKIEVTSSEMPTVEKWQANCLRLRAFIDRKKQLYVDSLPNLEYQLLAQYRDDPSTYQHLVDIYRDEYFSYQERENNSRFYLQPCEDGTSIPCQVQRILLEKDETVEPLIRNAFQQSLDTYYNEHRDDDDIMALRMSEKEMLMNFTQEYLGFQSQLERQSRALNALLVDFEPLTTTQHSLKLNHYFQSQYDLIDQEDLLRYLGAQEKHDELQRQSDIARIRERIQHKIIANNIDAETKLSTVAREQVGDVLMDFAAKEQQWVSYYRSLLTHYFAYINHVVDPLVFHKPFEMYFDNYFADFDNTLQYYVLLYNGQEINPMQTPYYNKIYTATKTKITVTNTNFIESIEHYKKSYISDRNALTELTQLKREYEQEIDSLIDEFKRYGTLYLSAIDKKESTLQEHLTQVTTLQNRYDLRMNNEFF